MRRLICLLLSAAALGAIPGQAGAKGPLVEPDTGPDPRGLTLSGTGLAYVTRPARATDTSIRRAVAAARPSAIARAVAQARRRAQALAATARLTLGPAQDVTERDATTELGLGEERYCSRGGRPRCRVPLFSAAGVTVTFATAQTSAAVAAGRALVADGDGTAAVRPRDRRSSASIRRAMDAARVAAAPAALVEARADADGLARAAGIPPGPVFSIAEVRRPYEAVGSFGPGRFCGTVRRPVFGRDPGTGRRRVVRRISQRRCFFSTTVSVGLRITLVAP
ncbi:MAG TPA: hypothetical protein VNT03_21800 [Baekduia sp.]|nr:hypothetical protein [Baekduia sp.]